MVRSVSEPLTASLNNNVELIPWWTEKHRSFSTVKNDLKPASLLPASTP